MPFWRRRKGVHRYVMVEMYQIRSIKRRDEQTRDTAPGRDTLEDAE